MNRTIALVVVKAALGAGLALGFAACLRRSGRVLAQAALSCIGNNRNELAGQLSASSIDMLMEASRPSLPKGRTDTHAATSSPLIA
jgi:hypothetical protein